MTRRFAAQLVIDRAGALRRARQPSQLSARFILALALQAGTATSAAELSPLVAPAPSTIQAPRLAGIFDLELLLPDGRGLARLLLDAGVDQEDAAAAARAAAGFLGDGLGGCEVKVTLSRPAAGSAPNLQRLVLTTSSGKTIIERRGGRLAVVTGKSGAAHISSLT